MQNELLDRAQALAETISADRRALHARAETGFDLPQTFDYVWKALTDMGLTPRRCGRCGIVAEIGAGSPCVLLRADMDALPIREESGEAFACPDGRMHACGHDMHTAMLLGAARLLTERAGELQGTVRLMFQPAEEIFEGSADMLADGLLAAPRPDCAFMIHVMTNIDLPVGTVIVSAPGVSAPAAEVFRLDVQGKGCHGAMPHTGVDPITAAAQIVLALQSLNARELSLNQPAALTIGSFQAGDAPNVIPDSAVLQGSLRAFEDDTADFLLRRMEEVARHTAAAHRAEARLTRLSHAPTLLNDAAVSPWAKDVLAGVLGRERVLRSDELTGSASRSSGSEDFAAVSHAVPSVMVALAAGRPGEGYAYPAHHPKTRFDEAALPVGAAVYAAIGLAGTAR